MNKRAAIIGGGITGLTLAYFLLRKGIRPVVFEKEDHLGGALSTFRVEDAWLEKFYHHFFVQDSAAFRLLEELSITDHLYWVYPRMGFYSRGKIYSFTTPLDLLRFSPVNFAGRVKFGLFSLKAKKVRDWMPLENITARDWITSILGENLYLEVWKPMLRGKFGSHADRIPASFAWSRLKARSLSRARFGTREKLGYLRGSYQVLIRALADCVRKMGGEIRLNCGTQNVPLSEFDRTIVTTPNLLSFPDVEYLGNICMVLKLKNRFSHYYWTNIGDESVPFCALIEHTNAFEDKGYNDFRLLYVSNYLEHSHPLWGASDREVFNVYARGLKKIKPSFSENEVAEYFVFREKFAQPIPTLGHSRKIPPFAVRDKLYYVSSAQIYPEDRGVSDSIRLAEKFVRSMS